MGFFGGGGGGAAPADMVGATSSVAGTAGLVPAPSAGRKTRALFSNATFSEVPIIPESTQAQLSDRLLMSMAFSAGNANLTPTDKERRFCLIYMPNNLDIDTLWYRTSSAPATSLDGNVALWEIGTNGLPSDYIIGANQSSGTAANTIRSVAIATTSLNRGYYYISYTSNGALGSNTINGIPNTSSSYMMAMLGIVSASQTTAIPTYTTTTYDQITHGTFSITEGAVAARCGVIPV